MKLLTSKNNRGFVILFAIVISSIILAIALSIANIALKEENFSTSAEGSDDAFFAADVGIECALANDRTSSGTTAFVPTPSGLPCLGTLLGAPTYTSVPNPTWTFFTPAGFGNVGLGTLKKSCAVVSVVKAPIMDPLDHAKTDTATTITSDGYNISSSDSSCPGVTIPANQINRELKVMYTL